MHTLRLRLVTTAYDRQVMEKRFHALSRVHNVMVKHAKRLLKKLDRDPSYIELKKQYAELRKKSELSPEEQEQKKELADSMNEIRVGLGLTENAFQSYLKVCGHRHSKCLSSEQVQKEATRVWKGVDKVLFSDGKEIHFKKYMDFDTIPGKSNKNGAVFDKETFSVKWIGLKLACKLPKKFSDLAYIAESIDHQISYCEIERKMFPNGWHYYVIVYLHDEAPTRHRIPVGADRNYMGIDPGVSTIAAVSDTAMFLEELAPDCSRYSEKIMELQEAMDKSRRKYNPDYFNEDGTLKPRKPKEKRKWVYSNAYIKNRQRLKSLYRQKAAYTKQSHEELANRLLQDSVNFIVEDMDYKALQKKAKPKEKTPETPAQRRKRFGKSLNNRAPASFLKILERKAKGCGGKFIKINTKTYKASQYDHITDSYLKTPLSQRSKQIGGHPVQRDLYSAFLIRNSNGTHDRPDRAKCIDKFDSFLTMQSELISDMKQNGLSMKQCFGF